MVKNFQEEGTLKKSEKKKLKIKKENKQKKAEESDGWSKVGLGDKTEPCVSARRKNKINEGCYKIRVVEKLPEEECTGKKC